MTIAFWCVLIASFIPYVFIVYSKASVRYLEGDHNKNPREYEETLEGARKRAYWAHLNTFEALPPFAAGVIIAHIAGGEQGIVDGLAAAFVVCRLLYGVLYIVDQDKLRSVVWAGGQLCTVGLFLAAAGVLP